MRSGVAAWCGKLVEWGEVRGRREGVVLVQGEGRGEAARAVVRLGGLPRPTSQRLIAVLAESMPLTQGAHGATARARLGQWMPGW